MEPPTHYPLYIEGGVKSAPHRVFEEPKKAGSNRVKIDRFFSFFLKKGIVQKLGSAIISITNVPTHSPHSLLKHLGNIFLLKKSESELSE